MATRGIPLAPRPDNVCICFHVPLGKLVNFARRRRLRYASQLSECHGAGTGCGWCIPFLERIFEQVSADPSAEVTLGIDMDEYLRRRAEYRARISAERMKDERPSPDGGTTDEPGATPP